LDIPPVTYLDLHREGNLNKQAGSKELHDAYYEEEGSRRR
jgi:hypothetical protein